jgi:tRNA-modifying protein YgfZ
MNLPSASVTIIDGLIHSGLIRFAGPDAQAFLHAQLTSDVAALDDGRSQYSGYCTPKGRLIATMLVVRQGESFLLQVPALLREALQKRLSMYILRSKVKVYDATPELAQLGLTGAGAAKAIESLLGAAPNGLHEAVSHDGATAVRLPLDRYLLLVPHGNVAHIHAALGVTAPAQADYWEWLNIRAGVPTISLETQEEFVPQMVNLDKIGALTFTKGCYPGQEIVARMHYLGKLKERMYLAHLEGDSAPAPGDKLYGSDLGDQATGMIVNAARSPEDRYDLLVAVRRSSVAAGPIRWRAADGPELTLGALPYEVE